MGMSPKARVYWVITFLLRVSLIVAMFGAAIDRRWSVIFVVGLAFLLTLIPRALRTRKWFSLPLEFELTIVVFVYATLFLGSVQDWYVRIWWWDIVMHVGSGIGLGLVGFLIMYALLKGERVVASPMWIAVFAFSFAVALGALWEIFEFAVDQLLGYNMQKSGLVDTMWDLVVDALGALLASFVGFLYLKGRRTLFLDRAITAFVKKNPELFS